MNNVENARELLSKHLYIHGGDGLVITDGNVYRAVIDAIDEALRINNITEQSEQLRAFLSYVQESQNHGETIIDNNEFVEGYLEGL